MIITKISAQKNNPDRVNIFVDSKYSFSLTINQVINEKIKLQQELDGQKIKYFQKISEEGKQKAKALEWLMLRPHSEKEFNEYIFKKKIDKEVAEQWKSDFIKFGYLSDQKFTKFWIDNRKSKSKSNRYIISELKAKGISSELINTSLKDNSISDDEALKKLITTKRKQSRYQDDANLTRYLISKGFNYSRIKELLAEDKL